MLYFTFKDLFFLLFKGTHWVWEILIMLQRGAAEYDTRVKEALFLDFKGPDDIKQCPSPRVLNCHYPCKLIPKGIIEKETKIVHVMRNPKDAFVSYYHHHKHFISGPLTQSFASYLPVLTGEYGIRK